MPLADLQHLEDDMKKCFRCSLCKMIPLPLIREPRHAEGCPANRFYHVHGYSGSGKSIMSLSLLDGRIPADHSLASVTFACTACGLCDVSCKFIMDAERHLINMALREYLVEQGCGLPAHEAILSNLRSYRRERSSGSFLTRWAREMGLQIVPGRPCQHLLLLGGDAEDTAATVAVASRLVHLLKHAGIEVGVLGDGEPDTGRFAYWTGHREVFREIAREVTGLLDSVASSAVIVLSGCDLGILRSKYPQYGFRPRARIVHATEILDELLARGRLRLTRPVRRRVTYHDPCYLGRQSERPVEWHGEHRTSHGCMTYTVPPRPVSRGVNGVFDPPRRLMRAISGIEFREMHRKREYAFCCGGGGGVPAAYPELSRSTALHRVEEARQTGAESLVTACSLCRETLTRAQEGLPAGERLAVADVVDLVFEASGLEP